MEELNKLTAYYKGSPITKAKQLDKPLKWKPMDKDWLERASSLFWSTNFKGIVRPEYKELYKLRDKLLTFGGEQVVLPIKEGDLENIMNRGQFWYGDNFRLKRGDNNQCHSNSAYLWESNRNNKKLNLHLATGYALSEDGVWRQHSWLVSVEEKSRENKIIETTVPRIAYFGFVMTEKEAETFFELQY